MGHSRNTPEPCRREAAVVFPDDGDWLRPGCASSAQPFRQLSLFGRPARLLRCRMATFVRVVVAAAMAIMSDMRLLRVRMCCISFSGGLGGVGGAGGRGGG